MVYVNTFANEDLLKSCGDLPSQIATFLARCDLEQIVLITLAYSKLCAISVRLVVRSGISGSKKAINASAAATSQIAMR